MGVKRLHIQSRTNSRRKTVYLCGAGGKGNIGAEAIMLSIIKMFQDRYADVHFIINSWNTDRIQELLIQLDDDFTNFTLMRERILANPSSIAEADIFIICGDVSISETVVSFLPVYYAIRTISPRLLNKRVIFLGIEAEKVKKWMNIFALKYLLRWTTDYHVLRNEMSLNNLKYFPFRKNVLLLGCEPTLMLSSEHLEGFEHHDDRISNSKFLVGFGVRDLFSTSFKLDILNLRLRRRDVPTGSITDEMRRIIHFTAAIADYLVEKYDAQPVFIPHHFLPKSERVILPDSEIAEMIINEMKTPNEAVILRNNLHPFQIINFYKRLDLVFSMRHHTNSFAYLNAVPTFGYGISEKIFNFFHEIDQNNMLIDPYSPEINEIESRIDKIILNRKKISEELRVGIEKAKQRMIYAFDKSLKGF
ncbi:MAG: polysaccharide pyruvyl transferase family protein [Deltaproteobacteria bacterium]|nr:polysaccharide pyruvyl transferase family protein [Deltaproteobacteria bacterium]